MVKQILITSLIVVAVMAIVHRIPMVEKLITG